MKEVTMKDTKQAIYDAYNEVKERLNTQSSAKFDPVAEKKAKEIKETISKAEKIVERGILSPEILDEFNALNDTIAIKKAELEEYYGIEREVNSIAALIEAKTIIEKEMVERYETIKANWDAKIEEVSESHNESKRDLERAYQERKAELDKQRQREIEEYKYNLDRKKKQENDAWEDEKAEREAALEEKEAYVDERLANVLVREENLDALEAKVAEMPSLLSQATDDGYKKAKSDLEKTFAIEKNAIKKEFEFEKKLLENEVKTLKEALAKAEVEKENALAKLEAAQERVQNIATESVRAAQPRIVESK